MRILISLLFLCILSPAFAQNAEQALEKFATGYPQEKVVLLFSKSEYLAGETIFFKAYVLNGYQLSLISTNLYAEFYDKEKKLLDKELIPLTNGSGEGAFVLPDNLSEDVYYVRAYTHWMLNFSEALQCIKPVHVYNPNSQMGLRPKPVQWTARAFAESGNLIDGVLANVAVRLYANGTLPSSWSGSLWEKETNTLIGDVRVYNSEIGQVWFFPQVGKKYQIKLTDSSGNAQEITLPSVKTAGIVLQSHVTKTNLLYNLSVKNVSPGGKGNKLVGSFNNQPVFTANITNTNSEVSGSFNLKDLPAGVMHLTLFDETETQVLERLCFLHQDSLPVSQLVLTTDTLSFDPKGRNSWQLTTDSLSWNSYSIEITDAGVQPEDNFLSALYLTSDFSTPLHNADWYFHDVNATKQAALDALLITEKWQRFQWSEILQGHYPTTGFKPERYLNYAGTVMKGKAPQPLRTMNFVLRTTDSSTGFVQVKTDNAGMFDLQEFFFTDTLRIFYQPEKQKFLERTLHISIESLNRFYPFNGTWPVDDFTTAPKTNADSLPLAIRKAVELLSTERLLNEKAKRMEEVVIKTKARSLTQELDKKLSSSLFSTSNAKIFDFINENQTSARSYTNILEWLQGRVAGLEIQYRDNTPVPIIRRQAVQVFLNEMAVQPDLLNGLSAGDIAMIKIFNHGFVGSMGGSNAIAIYTRRGGMQQKYPMNTVPNAAIAGYRKLPRISGPDYSEEANRAALDNRIILYRQTFAQPDATGKLPIIFYNNDSAKSFHMLVTGFTHEGTPVYLNRIIHQ